MSRYIDADKFLDWLDVGHYRPPCELCFSEGDVKDMIDQRPTADVVEVVRCKDCVHSLEITDVGKYICTLSNGLIGRLNGTEYCSYGARREKENDL